MSFYYGHVTQLFFHLTKFLSLTVTKIPIVALLILDTLYNITLHSPVIGTFTSLHLKYLHKECPELLDTET